MPSNEGSSRRSLVIGVLAISGLLILIGAMLPSPKARQIEERQRSLHDLVRVPLPKRVTPPAISIELERGREAKPSREITIHAYLDLTHKTSRYELLRATSLASSEAKGQTILHLRFDPKNLAQVRIATAVSAVSMVGHDDDPTDFRTTALASVGLAAKKFNDQLQLAEKKAGLNRLVIARRAVLQELTSGSATEHPAGTVVYEVAGRAYLERTPPSSAPMTRYVYSTDYYQRIENLIDPVVPLP